MADLKEVFQKYGNNYEITMSRFMGNEQLYLKILAMLPRDENLRKPDQALPVSYTHLDVSKRQL